MSSRVGTAMPASRSTALSSAALGLTRSIHTALSGNMVRSVTAVFFRQDSEGTNTENMKGSGVDRPINQQGLARFWQAFHDRQTNPRGGICGDPMAGGWRDPACGERNCP